MSGLAYDAGSNRLYGTTTLTNRLYEIDRTTGLATPIGNVGVPLMRGLAFDNATGTLYGTHGVGPFDADDALYRINTSTGQATLVGHTGFFGPNAPPGRNAIGALAIHPLTGDLYGSVSGP
jgi:hypothetical protein